MSRRIGFCGLIVFFFAGSGCGSSGSADCQTGALGCACGPQDDCVPPLECLSGLCVSPRNNAIDMDAQVPVDGASPADGSTGPDTDAAPEVEPECVGRAGTNVCDGSRLLGCEEAGLGTLLGECASARHCEGGRELDACLACLAGEHRCEGVELQACSGDDRGFEGVQTCPSAEVCNAEAGSCAAGCSAGQFSCDGAELRSCADDLTGFETAAECASEDLCDAQADECDACVPGEERCSDEVFEICNADGQAWTAEDCAATGEQCTASGCVQCVDDGDCSTTMTCREAYCDLGSATCNTRAAATCQLNASTEGVCTTSGQCVRCTQDEQCGPPTPFCSGNECVQCKGAGDCSGSFPVCNAGTCGIGPGCGNGRIDPGEECERGVSPGSGQGTWDVTNCDTTCHRTVYQNCSTAARIMACQDYDANCLIGGVVGLFCSPDVPCGFCPAAPGYQVECGAAWSLVTCYLACEDDGDCPADLYCYEPDFSLCCPSTTPSDACAGVCTVPGDCAPGESCVKTSPKLCRGRQL